MKKLFSIFVEEYKSIKEEDRRREPEFKAYWDAWENPVRTHSEAVEHLRRIGHDLQYAEVDQGGTWHSERNYIELTADFIRLDQYMHRSIKAPSIMKTIFLCLVQLIYIFPGARSKKILEAEKYTRTEPSPSELSISEYGAWLHGNAESIASPSPERADLLYRESAAALSHVRETGDSCAEIPGGPTEGLLRLKANITDSLRPPSREKRYTVFATVLITGLLSAASGPWGQIGDKGSINGVASFLVPLLGFTLCSTALCASIREMLAYRLCDRSIAKSKSLMKATTATLAFFTLTLSVGLSDNNDSPIAVAAAMLMLLATALCTVTSDLLVNYGEVRLRELDSANE